MENKIKINFWFRFKINSLLFAQFRVPPLTTWLFTLLKH